MKKHKNQAGKYLHKLFETLHSPTFIKIYLLIYCIHLFAAESYWVMTPNTDMPHTLFGSVSTIVECKSADKRFLLPFCAEGTYPVN